MRRPPWPRVPWPPSSTARTSPKRELARAWREALGARVVAVTGSAGKTSTRACTAVAMKRRYRVFASPGNLNSTVGAPLALLEADDDV